MEILIENKREEGKKERIDQSSTNTSKIVDQKQNRKEPIEFGNEIDSIFKDNPLLTNQ